MIKKPVVLGVNGLEELQIGDTLEIDVAELYPQGFVYGLQLETPSVSSVTMQPGVATADDGQSVIAVASVLTASLATSGANGLDAGAEEASRWYHVFVIAGANQVAMLLSLSATDPTMPVGYTYKRRIGAVRNDSAGNLLRMKAFGGGSFRKHVYCESLYNRVLLNGSATAYTQVDCSSYVSPASSLIMLLADGYRNQSWEALLRPYGSTAAWQVRATGYRNGSSMLEMRVNPDQVLQYRMANSGSFLSLFILSYYEEI